MTIKTMAREEFWEAAGEARSKGRDLAEMLEAAGVLLTPQRLADLEAAALWLAATRLTALGPTRMLKDAGLRTATPGDMHRVIVEYLEALASDIKERGSKR